MSSPVQEFADNLKLIRKGRHLTQTQLAEKIGLTKQSIINYEKGATFPTGKRLENLLDALDVNAEQLLGRELSQATSERVLLEECDKKARFWANYNQISESDDEEEVKKFLMNQLKEFDPETLFHAITTIYDDKIYTAQEEFTNDIRNSILHPNKGLNIDVWILQEDDAEA